MVEPKKNKHGDIFRDLFKAVEPIRFKEPFAETLGAFKQIDAVVDYTFIDVVKLAGHVCPATAGAYLCCQKALKQLYPDEIPVRGDITVTIHGQPHEGVYGVISQIFSFLTGAAPDTGFKGLGPRFRRKDLLKFSPKKATPRHCVLSSEDWTMKKPSRLNFHQTKFLLLKKRPTDWANSWERFSGRLPQKTS
jgi:hypothetical protein